MKAIYIPAGKATVPLPGGSAWPADGRPIDPLSAYERRLVKDGDIIEKPVAKAAAKSKETE